MSDDALVNRVTDQIMAEPISRAWLESEVLRIAADLLDRGLQRDASVLHQIVRRFRIASGDDLP